MHATCQTRWNAPVFAQYPIDGLGSRRYHWMKSMFVKEHPKDIPSEEKIAELRRLQLFKNCDRFINSHDDAAPSHQKLSELAEYCREQGWDADIYGKGELINGFEKEIAALLGMESAVFMPSGTMAQQIALRIWSDRSRCNHVAYHPTCHIEVNEQRGYSHLHGLKAKLLGERLECVQSKDLADCPERLSTYVLELPLRRIGGVLPSWEELEAIKAAARAKDIRLHMDGARLWESQPFYSRPLSVICRGFDSVYVSFYKGIGALSGSMLCGPLDFILEARIWLRRQGGNLFQLHPYVASAKMNFDERKNRFASYHDRAVSLARRLSEDPRLIPKPGIPHTNMMHLYMLGEVTALKSARDRIAEEDRFWLGGFFAASELPGWSFTELSVGDCAMKLSDDEVLAAFRKLLDHANRS